MNKPGSEGGDSGKEKIDLDIPKYSRFAKTFGCNHF